MSLRLAKIEDSGKIYEICLSVKEVYKQQNVSLWNEFYPLIDNFKEDILKKHLYVYLINGEIVGSISIGDSLLEDDVKEENVYSLTRFMVKPHLQNQGIGTIMINEIEKVLKNKDVKEIKFLVSNKNPLAIKLYLRQGCKNLGYIKTPWETENDFYYLFQKELV